MRITPNVKCQRVLVLLCGWSILCDWLVSSVTTILHNLLLSCISLLCIVTDRVAWYVCLSCEPSTDQDAVWDVDSGGPKEAGTRRGCTLTPPGEYDLTVHVWRRCGFMSNYVDHLLNNEKLSCHRGSVSKKIS